MLWAYLILLAQQSDATVVNDALYGIARLLASFLNRWVTIGLMFVSYEHIFGDSASRGAHLKKALMGGGPIPFK